MSQLDIAKAIFGDGGAGDKVTMRYGTAQSDVSENKLDVKLDGSDEPITVSCYEAIKSGQRVTVYNSGGLLKAICIGSGTIGGSAISADQAFFNKLFADEAFVGKLFADEAFVGHLEADYAKIGTLEAQNAKIENLEATTAHIENGYITNAYIDYANVSNLEANYAHIKDGVIDNAKIGYADVENLDANYAHITNGEIDNAHIDQAQVNNLDANYAHITEGKIDNATIDQANIENLDAHYANIELANVSNAWIEKGTIKDGAISNAAIAHGAITDAHIADATITAGKIASINADTINAGTIKTDRLLILDDETGEYGIVSAINSHAAVIEPGVIDVTDLRSFQATIGGFEITTDAIHSSLDGATKTAIDDPTPGVYIGHTGIGVGDGALVGSGLNVPAEWVDGGAVLNEGFASFTDDGIVLQSDHASLTDDGVSIFGDRGSPFEVHADGTITITGKNGGMRLDGVTGEFTIDCDKIRIASNDVVTSNEFRDFASEVVADVETIQKQIDGQIETWFQDGAPSVTTVPTKDWTDAKTCSEHVGDLYYDKATTTAYRYVKIDVADEASASYYAIRRFGSIAYAWQLVENDATARALALAADAKDTADGKRRVFVVQPRPPYDIGDLWTDGTDLRRCKVARQTGSYTVTDWELATNYQTQRQVTSAIEQKNAEIRLYVNDQVANETNQRKAEIKIERDRITQEVKDRAGLAGTVSKMQQGPSGFSWSVASEQYADGKATEASKTATNFMDFNVTNAGALTIGNKTNGSWSGSRAVLGGSGLDFQNASGVSIANYGDSAARIGRANTSRFQMSSESLTAYGSDNKPYFFVNKSGMSFGDVAVAKKSEADAAASAANAARTAAANADSKAVSAQAAASNAATAAADAKHHADYYMDFSASTGLTIGNKRSGTMSGASMNLTSQAIDFRDAGGTSLANYGSTARIGKANGGNTYIDGNSVSLRNGSTVVAKAFQPGGVDQARFEVFGGAGNVYLYSQTASNGTCGMYRGGTTPKNIVNYCESNKNLLIGSSLETVIRPQGRIIPASDNSMTCGNDTYAWSAVWAHSHPVKSSRRFKENIEPIGEAEASKVLDIDVVAYDYKQEAGGERGQFGVIAEDVERLFPSVITRDGDGAAAGVDYAKFVPHLLKMCQMQQQNIEKLEARVSELEGRL